MVLSVFIIMIMMVNNYVVELQFFLVLSYKLLQWRMTLNATSPEKDGFSAGEAIVWKFQDNNGNQYDLTPRI